MWYIRFLNAPHFTPKRRQCVATVFTITNDLGELFLSEQTSLEVRVFSPCGQHAEEEVLWRPGLRAIPLQTCVKERNQVKIQYSISCSRKDVLDVISLPFTDSESSAPFSIRQFEVLSSPHLEILESIGESIEGHVWDAGVCLSLHLPEIIQRSEFTMLKDRFAQRNCNILELGSGCGILGLTAAMMLGRNGRVTLSDLSSAEEVLKRNIDLCMDRFGDVRLRHLTLDWQSFEPEMIGNNLDVVLLSDCTYNPSSFDNLLRVLDICSKRAVILLAHKHRHNGEGTFFQRMHELGLQHVHHVIHTTDNTHIEVHLYW